MKYNILCINEVVETGEYREDGYTKNIIDTLKKNPIGYYKYFKEILQKDLRGASVRKKIYILKNYVFFLFMDISVKLKKIY